MLTKISARNVKGQGRSNFVELVLGEIIILSLVWDKQCAIWIETVNGRFQLQDILNTNKMFFLYIERCLNFSTADSLLISEQGLPAWSKNRLLQPV
jgi:ligand-binding sensor domain-containing protein